MAVKNQQYIKLNGGANLNVLDVLNNQQDKTIERLNIVCNNTLGGPINILLPEISALNGFTNFEITVADVSGTAAVDNIIITRGGASDKVNASTNATIGANFGKVFLSVASVETGAAAWNSYNTAAPASPVPTQTNETGLTPPGGLITLAQLPDPTQHVIVGYDGVFLANGLDYTRVGQIITPVTPLAGVHYTVFYSY